MHERMKFADNQKASKGITQFIAVSLEKYLEFRFSNEKADIFGWIHFRLYTIYPCSEFLCSISFNS